MSSRIQGSCPPEHITLNKDCDRGKGLVSTTCLPEYRAPDLQNTSHLIKIVIGVKASYPPHVFQNTGLLNTEHITLNKDCDRGKGLVSTTCLPEYRAPESTSHLIKIVIGVKASYPPHVFQNTGLLPSRAHHT